MFPVHPALFSPLALVLVGLLLRLVPGRPPEACWSWRVDGGLLVVAGLAAGGLYLWLGAYHVPTGYSVSDFPEHCGTVAAGIAGAWEDWTHNRSLLAGLPSVLAGRRVGVVDGLFAGSIFGAGLTGSGLFLWGRALHSRVAGVAVVILGGAIAPVAVLARLLNFYPTTTGLLTLACGLVAAAVRWRQHAGALALGSAGVALALLTDVRGFVWALALLPAVAGVALLAPPRRLPLRLAAVLLPLGLGYLLGPLSYPADHTPLEVQANTVRMLRERNDPAHFQYAQWDATEGFVWGRSDLRQVPETVRTLLYYRRVAASRSQQEPAEALRLANQVAPWRPLMAGAAVLAAWTLRRRLLLLLAAAATCAPFFAAWQGAIGIQRSHLRFLASSMPFLALLLGLALAALAVGPVPRPRPALPGTPPRPRGRAWRLPAATLVLALLVLGIVPSWLSPVAPWRRTILHEDGGMAELWGYLHRASPPERLAPCVEQLRRDREHGRPRWITPVDGRGSPL